MKKFIITFKLKNGNLEISVDNDGFRQFDMIAALGIAKHQLLADMVKKDTDKEEK